MLYGEEKIENLCFPLNLNKRLFDDGLRNRRKLLGEFSNFMKQR